MDYPPSLITPRTLLRPWRLADAAPLNEAVAASLDHLLPFMPWAALPPMSTEERETWILEAAERTADGQIYGLFDHDGAVLGGTGFHDRIGPGGIEIGYWVHVDHINQGYATEVSRTLTTAAFADATIEHVEIHHDIANVASGRVPEKLGYVRHDEYAREITAPGEAGMTVSWRITREQWASVTLRP
jgi:RimJ/RimL family protein N-acetyltransferase